jgi:hypothetical protein
VNEPSQHWFKPKSHGYGATPNSWQGWVVTAAAGLAPGVLGWLLLGGNHAGTQARLSGALPLIIWLIATLAIVVGFHRFVRRKTDGEWRWRWRAPANADDGKVG